jgi:hypothetical protein
MDKKVFEDFSKWLDKVLSQKMPESIKAYNFNLYEGKDTFHVQLIGSSSFSENDQEWACDEVFTTGENIFIIDRKITGQTWQEGLLFSKELVNEYLDKGVNAGMLKKKEAVAIGFVDGDLEVLYKN